MKWKNKLKSAGALLKALPYALVGLCSYDNTVCCVKGFAADKFLQSVVTLSGKRSGESFSNLSIEVSTGCETLEIQPQVDSGKKPSVELFHFDGSGLDFIFYSVETSSESCFCAVYSVKNGKTLTVFDSDLYLNETGFQAKTTPEKDAQKPVAATGKRKKAEQPESAVRRLKGVLCPVIAVFPYYNAFNGVFSLQVWQKSSAENDETEGNFFRNLKYADGKFCEVFSGIAVCD